jgi:hypothetical protein
MGENGQDFDFGTAAMKMLEGIRRTDDDETSGSGARGGPIEEVEEPPSPSPGVGKGLGEPMVLAGAEEPRRSGEYRRRSSRTSVERRTSSASRMERSEERGDGMEYIEEASREEE